VVGKHNFDYLNM